MKEWWTAMDLVQEKLPGLPGSRAGIQKMAERQNWESRHAIDRRGGGREFALAALPETVRIELARRGIGETVAAPPVDEIAAGVNEADAVEAPTSVERPRPQSSASLPDWARERAERRLEILAAFRAFARAAQGSEPAALDRFIAVYNAGGVEISDATRIAEPQLAGPTLRRWRSRVLKFGAAALAGRYGNRSGAGKIDQDASLQSIILGMIARNPGQIRVRRIFNLLRARHAAGELQAVPCYSILCDWVRGWKRAHRAELENLANPDRARGMFRFSVGIAAPDVVRPLQLVEFDNTSADVMTTRGRYSVTLGVDIYSRRMRAVVTSAPKAASTICCLRKLMREFGSDGKFVVPEGAHTDNGTEFTARWVVAAFADLGIEHNRALPYHAWEKPYVESANKTFLHGFCEEESGFTGHDVTEAQAIRSRKTLAQRLALKSRDRELVLFRVNLSPEELQARLDRWIETVYENSPHSGLGGRTPREVWNAYDGSAGPVRTISDERALDVLLAEVPGNGGMRTVGKNGISVSGFAFADSALAGMAGQRVYLRHDPSDIGRLWVFSEDRSQFICVARNLDLMDTASRNDLARTLTGLQALRTGQMRKRMRAHERGVRNPMGEILDYFAANAPEIRAISGTEEHSTPAMVAAVIAAEAAEAERRPAEPHYDADILAEGERLIDAANRPTSNAWLTDDQLWEKYLRLREAADVCEEDRFWIASYESTPECRVNLELERIAASKIAAAG